MKVSELIFALNNEDPNATVVIILDRYRHLTLRQLQDYNSGDGKCYLDTLAVAGKETGHRVGGGVACVLIAGRDE